MDVQEWSMISYLSRVNYSYKGKYLIGQVFVGMVHPFRIIIKWGNFPSVSLGWIVSDEAFMGKLKSVSLLKVRGSYGMIGNNNIGNYTHYNTVKVVTRMLCLVVLSQAEVLLRILETMIWDGKNSPIGLLSRSWFLQ